MKKELEKRAYMLFKASRECAAHAELSFENEAWNMAIRRCQEAVELELTGLLALIGLHYPKDHDQAPLLLRRLKAKGIEITDSDKVEFISADLSRKRGPALHQEDGYTEINALKALDDIKYIFSFSEKVKLIL